MSETTNPYEPLAVPAQSADQPEWDIDAPVESSVRLTKANIRHFESHYLLHWHPIKILVASLLLIAMSVVVIVSTARLGLTISLPAVFFCLSFSTLVYSLIVAQSKTQLRARLKQHGILDGEEMTVRSEANCIVLETVQGRFEWPNDQVRLHAARGGLLLCPEPLLFLLVPKQAEFSQGSFQGFRQCVSRRLERSEPS